MNVRLTICLIFVLSVSAFAQTDYAVLVQESPPGAGEIKPGLGVHSYSANESVTLTTVARSGWRFVYWLGDVSDATANRTMLSVDGPKIIIAVFQRDEFELPAGSSMSVGAQGDHLIPRYDQYTTTDSGGSDYTPPNNPPYYPPEPPNNPPPVPTPEPTTAVLFLGIGTWFMTIKRKK